MHNQSDQLESTHIVFDGEKMIISPDIVPVFIFLMEIEKEIESILNFQKQLNEIREQYLDITNFVLFLGEKLKENNIDFNYTLKMDPSLIAEKFNLHLPLRSQMIVLFASVDVLFNLHTAYGLETNNEEVLRKETMDTGRAKLFINHFLLNEANSYYKSNKVRFSKIDSTKIRNLRNSLTHFFSISAGGISVSPHILKEKTLKLEKLLKQNKHGHVIFISPEDLYGLIKDANVLQVHRWSEDFQKNPTDFKRKIQFVISVVKEHGAVIVKDADIKI